MSSLKTIDSVIQVGAVAVGVVLSFIKSNHTGSKREDCFRGFFEQEGIRDDITIEDRVNFFGIRAIGANLLPRPSISVFPGLFEHDREAYGFVVKKGVSFIKSNDAIKMPVALLIVFCAASIFSHKIDLSLVKHLLLTRYAVGIAALLIIRNQFYKHINFVCEKATNEELFGGLRLLRASVSFLKNYGEIGNLFSFIDQKQISIIESELKKRKIDLSKIKGTTTYEDKLHKLLEANARIAAEQSHKKLKTIQTFYQSFIK